MSIEKTYESLTYRNKFRRACKIGLITLAICFAVIVPLLYVWDQSIQERQTLRETKNVVRNMNLLAIQYYGLGEKVADVTRESGMTAKVEKDVVSYSGAEGRIHLVSWNSTDNCVASMNYQKGKFLIEYKYDSESGEGAYTIYWKIHTYES